MSQSVLDDEQLLTMSPLSSLPPSSPPPPSPASSSRPSPLLLPQLAFEAELAEPSAAGTEPVQLFHTVVVSQDTELLEDTAAEAAHLPASSDPGITPSSPAIANENESVQDVRRRKGQKKRRRTLADQQALRDKAVRDQLHTIAEETKRMQAERDLREAEAREASFEAALEELTKARLTWGDFVQWVCKPGCGRGKLRQRGMFEREGQVEEVLDLWATKNSPKGRKKIHDWAVHYLSKVVSREADDATGSGILMSRRMVVDESFVLGFNLRSIHHALRASCPSMASLMYAFSTSKRQRKVDEKSKKTPREELAAGRRAERKDQRVGSAMCDLLGERSQNNSYIKHVMGLYLYATGAQRQVLSVLSTLGLCSSYPSLAGSSDQSLHSATDDTPTAKEACSTTNDLNADDSDSDDPDWLPDLEELSSDEDDEDDELEFSQEQDASIQQPSSSTAQEPSSAVDEERAERDRDAIESVGKEDAPLQAPVSLASRLLHRGAGLLKRVSEACRLTTRGVAQACLCGHVYDNINMMFRIAEQILGRKDTQENGTCATVFPLHDARPEDMLTSDLLASFDAAPPLSAKDIRHTPEEAALFHTSLEHAVLRDLTSRSDLFARFRPEVDACLPGTDDQIPLHRTEVYPLPSMNIDESSITGNAEVVDTIFKELGFDIGTTKFSGYVRPMFGDQLSISRLRTLIANRAGHDSLSRSYGYLAFGPGFFHHQIALTHGILETHFGDPSVGVRNPASLSFFNDTLNRKPVVLTSLPPYRTCRDLILTTLSGCLLHCLEQVSGCESLAEYAKDVSFDTLCKDVAKIMTTYVNPAAVAELRRKRQEEIESLEQAQTATPAASSSAMPPAPPPPSNSTVPPADPHTVPAATAPPQKRTQGDVVLENISLFLRDALVLREFNDAIKGGYSGRIIRVLKLLGLMYRGCGRTKYAHEVLHLVHNLTYIWPKPLSREIMIKNWLVNPSGKPNSWVPVDLLQEHMNFWIKVIYKAQGSNASWEWIKTISPCIALLRKLALEVNNTLGAKLGSKHHTPALDKDFEAICDSLRTHGVFEFDGGRVIDTTAENKGVVPNIISVGLDQLRGPLSDYNHSFRQLQRRRRLEPLLGVPAVVSPLVDEPDDDNLSALIGVADEHDGGSEASDSEEEEEAMWRTFDNDTYEPRAAFAAEENPSLDIDDY